MNETGKRKLDKTLRMTIGITLTLSFFVLLIASARRQSNKGIAGLEVRLNDENEYCFLQKKDIENLLLTHRHIDLKSTALGELDLKKMEAIAKTHPWVADADVFVDNKQTLTIHVTQREPVARIFDAKGGSFYIDGEAKTMPALTGHAFPCPVFTNVPLTGTDSLDRATKASIAYMGKRLAKDAFWNAQITQIEFRPDVGYTFVPLVGKQKIWIGDTTALEEKLGNLRAFYKNVSSKIGWNKYDVLDLRFKGQIVASPSIGWAPPKPAKDTVQEATPQAPQGTATNDNITPKASVTVANATVAAVKPPQKEDKAKTAPLPDKTKLPETKKTANKDKTTGKEPAKPKYIYTGKATGNP